MRDLLTACRGKSVLIIGDVMMDEYIWGEVRRVSPEAPVPVVEIRRRTYIPGGAGNTSVNVASLGGRVLLGGVVGRDQQAEQLRGALMLGGVEADGLVVDAGRPTTTKTRIVAHNQQVVRVDSEDRASLSDSIQNILLSWAEEHLPKADACIISDYAKGVVSARLSEDIISLSRKAGKPVVVDPKGVNYAKYRGATMVTPNVSEVERALGSEISDDVDMLQEARQLLDILPGCSLLITRGPRGMSLFRDCEPPVHIPSEARKVFDVTGAGDTVVGTLALALAAGISPEQAARMANHAAGIVVGKLGTAVVTVEDLLYEEFIRGQPMAAR